MMTAAQSEALSPPQTKPPLFWIQIGVGVALILALYGDVLIKLANDWLSDPVSSQGLLIPPLALYMAWLRRNATLSLPLLPDWRGVLLTGAACMLFVCGKLAAEFFVSRISFVILLAGVIWTFWGAPRLKTLTFPLLLLATMIPLPAIVDSALAAPLQLLASDAATNAAQFLGVSIYRDGNIIHLAHTSLGVERACSGLSSLSSLVLLSVMLGFLQCSRPVTRILLFASSIPIAIGVNALRVTATAVLADYDEKFAMGFYHSFTGWLVFLPGLRIALPVLSTALRAAGAKASLHNLMISQKFLITSGLLVATLATAKFTERRNPATLAAPLATISRELAGWSATADEQLPEGTAATLAASSYLTRGYRRGQDQLTLFIAFYEQQRAGESMHSPKHCLPGAGWEIWDYRSAQVPVGGRTVKINKYFIQHSEQRALMLYWYQSRQRIIASEYLGKIFLLKDALLEGKTDGSIVRIMLQDQPGAAETGIQFASSLIPEVQRCFGSGWFSVQ